jgi:hypothetical protein
LVREPELPDDLAVGAGEFVFVDVGDTREFVEWVSAIRAAAYSAAVVTPSMEQPGRRSSYCRL